MYNGEIEVGDFLKLALKCYLLQFPEPEWNEHCQTKRKHHVVKNYSL